MIGDSLEIIHLMNYLMNIIEKPFTIKILPSAGLIFHIPFDPEMQLQSYPKTRVLLKKNIISIINFNQFVYKNQRTHLVTAIKLINFFASFVFFSLILVMWLITSFVYCGFGFWKLKFI